MAAFPDPPQADVQKMEGMAHNIATKYTGPTSQSLELKRDLAQDGWVAYYSHYGEPYQWRTVYFAMLDGWSRWLIGIPYRAKTQKRPDIPRFASGAILDHFAKYPHSRMEARNLIRALRAWIDADSRRVGLRKTLELLADVGLERLRPEDLACYCIRGPKAVYKQRVILQRVVKQFTEQRR